MSSLSLWWMWLLAGVSGYFYQHHAVNHPLRCPAGEPRWTGLHAAVERAHAAVKLGQSLTAERVRLAEAIETALKPGGGTGTGAELKEAFECSVGFASAFRVLALLFVRESVAVSVGGEGSRRGLQIGLRLMHTAMNWLTHAFVVKGENDGRWIDESSWPLTIQAMNDEQTYIQNEITKTGPYGDLPTWADCPYDYRTDHRADERQVKIAIVTMCDYPAGHVLPRYSLSTTHLYAEKHGYTVLAEHRRLDASRPHAWGKIKLMQKYMDPKENGGADWILWLDCDSYFMNHDVTLEHVLFTFGGRWDERTGRAKLDEDFYMLIQEDHAMLNTGVFFLKVNDWARALLDRIYGPSDSPWINHPWWENAAFSHDFLGNNHMRFIREDLSSALAPGSGNQGAAPGNEPGDMHGIYGEHIRVAPQVVFNSYHPITSRIFQHDTWEPGKFILAFSGCTSGSSPNVAQHIYGEYYRQMCEINGIGPDKCVSVIDLPFHPWVINNNSNTTTTASAPLAI